MITNKDLSIDRENGKITLNGNKYDLGTQGEIEAALKDVYSVMGQMGAKNLIPYPFKETTKTVNGITFTDNEDGTITVSGTASADATFNIRDIWSASDLVELLPNTIYAFNGCPVGGSVSTYLIQFVNEESDLSNKSWIDDTGTGGTLTTTDVKRFVGLRIVIKSGVAFSTPVTFKPMLRLAADTDNTYEPYAMTNKQLTEQVATKQDTLTFDNTPTASSDNPVKSGGIKTYTDNLIKPQYVSGTISTLTANSKTTIDINLTIPTGYTALGITSAFTSTSNAAVVGFFVDSANSKLNVNVANLSSSDLSNVSVAATAIYVRA